MSITSQVSIVSANHHLAFESVETEAMDFASTALNGIVWTPDNETKAKLAMTNTTSAPLDITATGNAKVQLITLKGRETRVINLEDYLGDSRATLVTLNHDGPLGALIATGFALNEETGFSTNLNFVDCATAKATRLAAAHVRFGQADPQEGFLTGTSFTAPLAVANTMDTPAEAQISVTYTDDSVTKTVKLKPVTLGAREVKLVELSKQMARNGVNGPVEDAGVDISYTHMPGTVIGRLTSYDAAGDYSFDVPVKDPVGQGNGGYPWRLDNGYSTVVHLKNTLDKETTAVLQVRYDGGSYNPDRIKLAPYQTVAIDIRQLRDAQKNDLRGGVMPKEAESGQVAWFEEEVGTLIGRAEVANISTGLASSFSCGECGCGPLVMDSCYMNPSSGTAEPGVVGFMFAPQVMKRDCHYVHYGPYSPSTSISWSSTNTSVVTVDGAGNETTIAPGSGTILARWAEVVGVNYSCAAIYANVTASANCDVQCAVPSISISQNTPLWFFGNSIDPPSTFTLGSTRATLTANGATTGTFEWTIIFGTDKMTLGETPGVTTVTNTDSNTVNIRSMSGSINEGDVVVRLRYTLPCSTQPVIVDYGLTIDWPYYLVPGTITHRGVSDCVADAPSGTDGFQTMLSYTIQSHFGITVTQIGINEFFYSFQGFYPNENWPTPNPPQGGVTPDGRFRDNICIVGVFTPIPLIPQSPLLSVLVDKRGQRFSVGSINANMGLPVQEDSATRYQDHGAHEDIVTPAP